MTVKKKKEKPWRKVEGFIIWTPNIPSETIIGKFGGIIERRGPNGVFNTVLIYGKNHTWSASGANLLRLFESANLKIGTEVKVVYTGFEYFNRPDPEVDLDRVRMMTQVRTYDLFIR